MRISSAYFAILADKCLWCKPVAEPVVAPVLAPVVVTFRRSLMHLLDAGSVALLN